MASHPQYLLLLLLLSSLLFSLSSSSSAQPHPHGLLLPVSKDPATLQYTVNITQRTPPHLLPLILHLGASFLWLNCDSPSYLSSSYRPIHCHSAACSLSHSTSCGSCNSSPPRPGCNNNTCGLFPENPFTHTSTSGELAQDSLSLLSTDGSTPGPPVSIPSFLFSCAPSFLTKSLAKHSVGIAGLGRSRISLPSQLAADFSLPRKFALCLTSSPSSNGVVFFGDGPYHLLPNLDASQSLIYTPLLINPVSTAGVSTAGEKSDEYFIGVTAIRIGETPIPLNTTLLKINPKTGFGGTKISTVDPYTVLETSIYKAVTSAFVKALSGVKRVGPVGRFGVCYNEKDLGSTRVGAAVPAVDLVMQSVYWRMFGANTMVEAKQGVLCLGFVDGGAEPRTSIVVGGYQLEDNLLQFDLARSRLGFSSSLLFRQTTCANFNFTSTA